jgi:hypothetical protein
VVPAPDGALYDRRRPRDPHVGLLSRDLLPGPVRGVHHFASGVGVA